MRVDAQLNRDKIIQAARLIFVHEGPDAPLEKIARRAGVGIATLYRRFPSREDLVMAVATDTLRSLHTAVRSAAEEQPDAFGALRVFMHAALDLKVGAIMPSLLGRIDVEDIIERSGDALVHVSELLQAAQAADEVRADVLPGDVIFMVVRLTRPLPGRAVAEDAALAHRQLEIYLDGLRSPGASPRHGGLPGPAIGSAWFRRIRARMAGAASSAARKATRAA
ncbi:TetR/AcrR family transcriptional regulator [Streptomyces sp. Tue6028]|uniref:TetR/AcrR family transcriptional regulator n=1 Tax=Streptomyces sp. Tue6028 TaxID=2036037 RepID=UPI003EBBC865